LRFHRASGGPRIISLRSVLVPKPIPAPVPVPMPMPVSVPLPVGQVGNPQADCQSAFRTPPAPSTPDRDSCDASSPTPLSDASQNPTPSLQRIEQEKLRAPQTDAHPPARSAGGLAAGDRVRSAAFHPDNPPNALPRPQALAHLTTLARRPYD
jgi:hypothetical protein